MSDLKTVAIIGAGLAGCEAALVLGGYGVRVELHEMRPERMTPAHSTGLPAELVCSNSFKSDHLPSAHGLLKHELETLGSPLIGLARQSRIPAAKALAVDRSVFSSRVLEALEQCPLIKRIAGEVDSPPVSSDYCIIAAGPLASDSLVQWLCKTLGTEKLHFYDAIAPILVGDSIDRNIVFAADRWENGTAGDYLNCPFDREQYDLFYKALVDADTVTARQFENEQFFEACLPVEVAARRSVDALRFGPMRPVGLVDPKTGKRPFAVCQLRRENAGGESWGLVGFQTRLIQESQKQVFRMIPGLKHAEFYRYGSIHRNTYLDSPRILSADLSVGKNPSIFLAGQICGNEGYTESLATGHLAALFVLARLRNIRLPSPPPTTAVGAILRHVTASAVTPFTPSNINFGLLDSLPSGGGKKIRRQQKQEMLCDRALRDLVLWKESELIRCIND
jgi:methylenetetrahydrofolate--tRNA-(uracil-5-)-methyltransferase